MLKYLASVDQFMSTPFILMGVHFCVICLHFRLYIIAWHLFGLIVIFHFFSYGSIRTIDCCTWRTAFSGLCDRPVISVSSAKICSALLLFCGRCGMSLMYRLKRVGPIILPCATPLWMGLVSEMSVPQIVWNFRFLR